MTGYADASCSVMTAALHHGDRLAAKLFGGMLDYASGGGAYM